MFSPTRVRKYMKSKNVHRLSVGGAGCGDVRICSIGTSLRVEYEYRQDKQDLIGVLEFEDMIAFRFREEMYSAGFLEASYDAVLTVERSSWLKELAKIRPSGLRKVKRHHFALYLSNLGYLEVIAEGFRESHARQGLLPR